MLILSIYTTWRDAPLQSAAAPGFLGPLFGWQQDGISDLIQATPIATNLPHSFFCRPAELVAP